MGEGPHEVPESRPLKAVPGSETKFGVHTAGVFEPDLVSGPPGVGVVEEGGLGRLVVLDGHAVLDSQLNGPLVGDGLRPGLPLDIGKGPVVAVVGHSQENFFRRDFGDSIVQHRPDVWEGGYRHGGAVGVSPLIWMPFLCTPRMDKRWILMEGGGENNACVFHIKAVE